MNQFNPETREQYYAFADNSVYILSTREDIRASKIQVQKQYYESHIHLCMIKGTNY